MPPTCGTRLAHTRKQKNARARGMHQTRNQTHMRPGQRAQKKGERVPAIGHLHRLAFDVITSDWKLDRSDRTRRGR